MERTSCEKSEGLHETGSTPGTGFRINLGGYCGVTVAWVEGIEVNLLGAVAGIDLRRPGLKLPGLGRVGF